MVEYKHSNCTFVLVEVMRLPKTQSLRYLVATNLDYFFLHSITGKLTE